MVTRSAPWQYEWKRPEWQASSDADDDGDFSVDGVPVSTASAQITPRELQECQNTVNQNPFALNEEDDEASLLLSATLYSTGDKNETQSSVADVLLLELIQYTRKGAKRLNYRMLRWPGSTLNEDEEKRSWWRKKPTQQVGLVCVTLCRLPDGQDLAAASVDAMDVVALLSLGLDASEPPSAPQNLVESSTDEPKTTSDEGPTKLVMTCLTTDGRVIFYSPQKIFQPDKSLDDSQELENGLALLFLGTEIYQQLEQSVLPLSQPLAIVKLSVPLQKPKSAAKAKHDNLEVIPEDFELPEDEAYEQEDTAVKQELWEGSFWDANIEASTAKYHAVDNTPELMIPAFDFVAVAGHGTRIRRVKRRKKAVSASRGSSVSSWETASQQEEEKWELSAKTRSNTADSIDSKEGWWQESQVQTPSFDDEASNQSKKRQERSNTNWIEYNEPGGFVTFISLRYYAESRTMYLPFTPKQLSSIVWGGMHFVIVLGDEKLAPIHAPLAIAIRVDSFDVMSVPCDEAPSAFSLNDFGGAGTMKSSPGEKKNSKRKQMCSVRRFRSIPILLPSKGSTSSEQVTAVAVSSSVTAPPAIALQYSSAHGMSGDLIVTLNSLKALDVVPSILTHRATGGYRRFGKESEKALAIRTHLELGHIARIPHTSEPSTTRNTWCRVGQGWSVYGVDDEVFFICWEGATASQGSFVSKIHSEEEYESKVDALTTLRLFAPVVSDVLPLQSLGVSNTQIGPAITKSGRHTSYLQLPFTSPYEMPSFVTHQQAPGTVQEDYDVEDVVKDALDSLAISNISSELPEHASRMRRPFLSHRERSIRLVRHCSSWTLLDETKENKTYYDSQVPVTMVQLGPLPREHFILSLRKVVANTQVASPFNKVLGWLSQSKDYFTAASVALDLLRDVDSLRDLRRAKEEGAHLDNERANLEGLLDGIIPLYTDGENAPSDSVLTQLADMSVGCLLKGGLSMSSTLQNFVQNNPNYDPGRACLMLVSAAVCSLSRDPKTVKSVMGADYEWPADDKVKVDDLLWPLRSLFRVGVARDYMSTILLLLNAAIPEEIRNIGDDGARASSSASLEICRSIVSMIISSSAADLMLDLQDETTGKRYWTSLDHETRLDLSLLSIDGKFPLLRQAEVRLWALEEMDRTIASTALSEAFDCSALPNDWLRTLCEACMVNAGCDLDYVASESSTAEEPERDDNKNDDDGILKHFETNRLAIEALTPSPGFGGFDFDLMIPALLLLEKRSVAWRDNACLSTQNVLDAACYLAGRHRKEESTFPFDGPTVMKQCAKSGNISAGANLIGGRNGLVLKCCDILISGAGTNMDDAEDYILNNTLGNTKLWTRAKHDKKKVSDQTVFELTDEHRNVLWMLDEYVLSIKTYGDFDTMHNRGKLDPVFAARSCFRTWYLLSLRDTTKATAWLIKWLRIRLDMKPDHVSPKRLACSALTCALMWPSTDELVDVGELDEASDETLLSNVLDMEGLFLVQLSQSCCGLVEAVPPYLAHEILRQVEASEAQEMRTSSSSFQVDV